MFFIYRVCQRHSTLNKTGVTDLLPGTNVPSFASHGPLINPIGGMFELFRWLLLFFLSLFPRNCEKKKNVPWKSAPAAKTNVSVGRRWRFTW